jgi:hypothetical protein
MNVVARRLSRQGLVVQTTHSIEMLEVGPDLLGAEDAADLCHEAWQLPGKLGSRNGHLRIVQELLADQVIESRHHTVPAAPRAQPDIDSFQMSWYLRSGIRLLACRIYLRCGASRARRRKAW